MDKIWYINRRKVIGRCGGDEKNEWPRRTDKSRALIHFLKINLLITKMAMLFNCPV